MAAANTDGIQPVPPPNLSTGGVVENGVSFAAGKGPVGARLVDFGAGTAGALSGSAGRGHSLSARDGIAVRAACCPHTRTTTASTALVASAAGQRRWTCALGGSAAAMGRG